MTELLADGVHECRKPRKCWQCNQMIAIGDRYRKTTWADGDVQTYSAHEDCHQAAEYYRKLADLTSVDEFPYLDCDLEPEDFLWLHEKFPAVAARLEPRRP